MSDSGPEEPVPDAELADEHDERPNDPKRRRIEDGDNNYNPKMSDPGPKELDTEHGDDPNFNYIKRMMRERGDISHIINIARLPNDKESVHLKTTVISNRLTARINKLVMDIKNRLSLLEKNIKQLNELVDKKDSKLGEYIRAYVDEKRIEMDETMLKYNAMTEQENNIKMERIRELKQQEADEKVKIQNMRDQAAAEEKEIDGEIKNLEKKNKRISQRIKDMRENASIKKKELEKKNEEMQNKMAIEKNNIVTDIESLRKRLNASREKSQNEIRELKQDQETLRRKIDTEMKIHETYNNNSIDDLRKTIEINEDKFMKKTQDMQCFFGNLKEILNAKKNPAQ